MLDEPALDSPPFDSVGGAGNCGGCELPDDGGPLLGMDELPLELLDAQHQRFRFASAGTG